MCVVLKNTCTVELSQQDCLPAIALPAIDLFVIRVRENHRIELPGSGRQYAEACMNLYDSGSYDKVLISRATCVSVRFSFN